MQAQWDITEDTPMPESGWLLKQNKYSLQVYYTGTFQTLQTVLNPTVA